MSQEPKKWYRAYPAGTKAGNEEQRFFIALARDPKYDWRSVAALSKATGLPERRIEEIIAKYHKEHIVLSNPKHDELWGYWENHKKLLPKQDQSIGSKDAKNRVDKATGVTADTGAVKKPGKKKKASP